MSVHEEEEAEKGNCLIFFLLTYILLWTCYFQKDWPLGRGGGVIMLPLIFVHSEVSSDYTEEQLDANSEEKEKIILLRIAGLPDLVRNPANQGWLPLWLT